MGLEYPTLARGNSSLIAVFLFGDDDDGAAEGDTGELPMNEYDRWRATWRLVPHARRPSGDEYRCIRCGHYDDVRREAHFLGCPYVEAEKRLAKRTEFQRSKQPARSVTVVKRGDGELR